MVRMNGTSLFSRRCDLQLAPGSTGFQPEKSRPFQAYSTQKCANLLPLFLRSAFFRESLRSNLHVKGEQPGRREIGSSRPRLIRLLITPHSRAVVKLMRCDFFPCERILQTDKRNDLLVTWGAQDWTDVVLVGCGAVCSLSKLFDLSFNFGPIELMFVFARC